MIGNPTNTVLLYFIPGEIDHRFIFRYNYDFKPEADSINLLVSSTVKMKTMHRSHSLNHSNGIGLVGSL